MDAPLLPPSPAGYHDFAGLARLRADAAQAGRAGAAAPGSEAQVARQAAQQFEAHFIQQMMKSMREAVERSDLFESGHTDLFQELMDKEIAVKMAQRGSLGLAEMITRQVGPVAPQAGAEGPQAGLPLAMPAARPAAPSTAAVLATRAPALPKGAGHE